MEIDKSAKEPKMQVRTGGPPGVEVRGDAWTHLQLRRLGYTNGYTPSPGSISECRLPGWDRGLATT